MAICAGYSFDIARRNPQNLYAAFGLFGIVFAFLFLFLLRLKLEISETTIRYRKCLFFHELKVCDIGSFCSGEQRSIWKRSNTFDIYMKLGSEPQRHRIPVNPFPKEAKIHLISTLRGSGVKEED